MPENDTTRRCASAGVITNSFDLMETSNLNEYDIDQAGLSAGNYNLRILREGHGGSTGFDILATATVPEPTGPFGCSRFFVARASPVLADRRTTL